MCWRRSVADQVDEELDFHLEMVTRDLIARGWHEPDARAEARRRFGDLAEVGARCRKLGLEHERNVRRAEYLAELRQDVRLAFRHLRRAPAFAAVLTWVATTRSAVLGFVYLFVFSLGMTALLVAVGLFSGTVSALPRAGAWMSWIKKAAGVVLLLMAEYYFVKAGQVW